MSSVDDRIARRVGVREAGLVRGQVDPVDERHADALPGREQAESGDEELGPSDVHDAEEGMADGEVAVDGDCDHDQGREGNVEGDEERGRACRRGRRPF